MSKKEDWGEIIQYLDGECYGTAPNLRTVYLGAEDKVREMLTNPDKRTGNKVIDGIINLEIQLKKEGENGKQGSIDAKHTTRKPIIGNNKRIRFSRAIGHKQPNIGRPQTQ